MAWLAMLLMLCLTVSAEGRIWLNFNGSQYSIEMTPVNSYAEAERNCSALQAILANVKTTDIFAFLKSHINLTDYPHSLYIGARRNKGTTKFRWNDGSDVGIPKTLWGNRQPNNRGGIEDCVTMGSALIPAFRSSYNLFDGACTEYSRYICEKKTETTTKTRTTSGDKPKLNTKATTTKPTTTATTATTTTTTKPTTTTTITTPTTTATTTKPTTTTTTPASTTTTTAFPQSTITTTTTTTPKTITQTAGKTANEHKTITSTTIFKSPVETESAPITKSSLAIHNTLSGSTTESNSTIIIAVSVVGSCVTIIVICIVIAFVMSKRRKKRLRQPTELDGIGNVFETAAGFEPDETYGNPVLTSFSVQEQPVTPFTARDNNPYSMASDTTAANKAAVETDVDQSLEKQNDPYSLASDVTPAKNDMYSVVSKKKQSTNADQSHLVTVAAEIYSTPRQSQDNQDVYNRLALDNGQPKAQDELENTGDRANAYGHLNIGQSESDNPYDVLRI